MLSRQRVVKLCAWTLLFPCLCSQSIHPFIHSNESCEVGLGGSASSSPFSPPPHTQTHPPAFQRVCFALPFLLTQCVVFSSQGWDVGASPAQCRFHLESSPGTCTVFREGFRVVLPWRPCIDEDEGTKTKKNSFYVVSEDRKANLGCTSTSSFKLMPSRVFTLAMSIPWSRNSCTTSQRSHKAAVMAGWNV